MKFTKKEIVKIRVKKNVLYCVFRKFYTSKRKRDNLKVKLIKLKVTKNTRVKESTFNLLMLAS